MRLFSKDQPKPQDVTMDEFLKNIRDTLLNTTQNHQKIQDDALGRMSDARLYAETVLDYETERFNESEKTIRRCMALIDSIDTQLGEFAPSASA